MERKVYPLKLVIKGDVGVGCTESTRNSREVMNGLGAITVTIEIDSEFYPKEIVYDSVREIASQAIECFR